MPCSASTLDNLLQDLRCRSTGLTEVDSLELASNEQELEKQLHANLEEDNSLFMHFCNRVKGEVGIAATDATQIVFHSVESCMSLHANAGALFEQCNVLPSPCRLCFDLQHSIPAASACP